MVPGSARNWIAVKQSNLNKKETKNMTTLHPKESIDPSLLRRGIRFGALALVLVCFALLQTAHAVTPAPDGGYANDNTAEGTNALFNLDVTTGFSNTAIGAWALYTNTSGTWNTAVGRVALYYNTGNYNTAIGGQALGNNTTGNDNTALGLHALESNQNGSDNTAIGFYALWTNTTGIGNTANGVFALNRNTASNNTATGYIALQNNTTGYQNTADGSGALQANTTGIGNTASGLNALFTNTSGGSNTANGVAALYSNTTGSSNTADGFHALANNTYGAQNTAVGHLALGNNTSGSKNVALGFTAGGNLTTGYNNTANGVSALQGNQFGHDNVAYGFQALLNTTGSSNIALGPSAGLNLTTGSNNIDIGALGVAGESGKIRIGTPVTHTATFVAGIYNVSEGGTIKPVYINSNGRLGTQPPASARRFKTNIKPMDRSSEALLALKPVTFHYKNDEQSTAQFGLIAEEVAKVNPELVMRDDNGEIYTVRYEAVNAMLLNEFLKEHRKVEQMEKQIDALTAGLEKVSAQLEASKPAPQLVNNP